MRDDPALYADMVTAVASHPEFVATPASTQMVRNLSLAAQVRAAIAANRHTQSGVNLEVTADNGQVHLKGSVRHLSIRDAVLAVVKEVAGVTAVSGDEVTVSYYHPAAV